MTDIPFKPGDVVRLKSGGPPMTILRIEAGVVYCQWFERTTPKAGRFPAHALELYQGPTIA